MIFSVLSNRCSFPPQNTILKRVNWRVGNLLSQSDDPVKTVQKQEEAVFWFNQALENRFLRSLLHKITCHKTSWENRPEFWKFSQSCHFQVDDYQGRRAILPLFTRSCWFWGLRQLRSKHATRKQEHQHISFRLQKHYLQAEGWRKPNVPRIKADTLLGGLLCLHQQQITMTTLQTCDNTKIPTPCVVARLSLLVVVWLVLVTLFIFLTGLRTY